MKYAIYTRCSTEEQNNGFSHDYQIHGLQSHSKLREGECIGIYSDTISGTTFERPQIEELIKYCKRNRGQIEYVFIYRWDRFSRDIGESFKVMRLLKDVGVEINCPDSWVNFQDPNWPLLQGINMGMAQSESLKISDRTKDGIYQANISGFFTGKCPIGYVRSQQNMVGRYKNVLTPDARYSDNIRKLFTNTSAGIPVQHTISELDLPVARSTHYRILSNIIYAGYINIPPFKAYPAKTVKGVHQPIISLATFEKVQKVLSDQRDQYYSRPSEDNIFYAKGSLICSLSGKKMNGYWSKGKKKRYPYYGTVGVKNTTINAYDVHSSIYQAISTLRADLPKEMVDAARIYCLQEAMEDKSQLSSIKKEITILQKRSDDIENDFIMGAISPEHYNKLMLSIASKTSSFNAKISQIETSVRNSEGDFNKLFEHLTDLKKLFDNLDITGKERLLKAIFPSGLTVDKKRNLRTPEINEIVKLFYSESGIYDFVEGKKNGNLEEIPSEGGERHRFRTHLQLLIKAIAG